MRDYFRPFRRKLGVVTVVIACVFAVVWTRSFAIADYISFVGLGTFSRACSYEGYVTWCVDYDLASWEPSNLISEWDSKRIDGLMIDYPVVAHALSMLNNRDIGFQVNRLGFGFGTMINDSHVEQRIVVFPHWSIVVPLTALSAWLLISKRRQPNKSEPTQVPAN